MILDQKESNPPQGEADERRKMTIEEMRESMEKAGFYSAGDIEKICQIEAAFKEECREISEQCEREGYPSHGSNYELRCGNARDYYDSLLAEIDANY